jgi:hypothetical protein
MSNFFFKDRSKVAKRLIRLFDKEEKVSFCNLLSLEAQSEDKLIVQALSKRKP